MQYKKILVLMFFLCLAVYSSPVRAGKIPVYSYSVIKTYPHDSNSYTQGLVFENGFLYESSGRRGFSALRKIELETGKIVLEHKLDPKLFGEGLVIYRDKIIQLTWRSGKGFVYEKKSFKQIKEFSYRHRGWGITYDGQWLIVSDGSANLRFYDPQTLKPTGFVEVKDDQGPVMMLNELEYVKGMVYANVWQTDRIAIIDLKAGRVKAWIDLKGLLETDKFRRKPDVLNGIAYDKQGDRLLVTGKLWPELFEIELIRP